MESVNSFLRLVASIPFIVICLILMMILVVIGTLAQMDIGAFAAQKIYFNSFLVYHSFGGLSIPVFPGGLTIGLMWLVSLLATSVVRFKWYRNNIGFLLSHIGIVLLIGGQGLTQILSEESMMSIEEGKSSNYAEVSREYELAFVETTNPELSEITSVPSSRLAPGEYIESPKLPFIVLVRNYWPNSALRMKKPESSPLANQGIGAGMALSPLPVTNKDDETNAPSAIIEIKDTSRSMGTWLVSSRIEDPQTFNVGERKFSVFLRGKRRYFPFSLTLKKFSHDIYPGTDIPKNFSSLVHIEYPEKQESRDVLIYMNHPLRFEGYTFYQASFGKNNTLSIFQVVKNPARLTPYISCIIVTIGLLIKFLGTLFAKPKRGLL